MKTPLEKLLGIITLKVKENAIYLMPIIDKVDVDNYKREEQLIIDGVMHWVACKDETPEEVRRVLAIMSSGLVSVCYVWQGEWYMNDKADTAEHYGYEVTHWMPLPEPPCA